MMISFNVVAMGGWALNTCLTDKLNQTIVNSSRSCILGSITKVVGKLKLQEEHYLCASSGVCLESAQKHKKCKVQVYTVSETCVKP